jgi:hypothetical protein
MPSVPFTFVSIVFVVPVRVTSPVCIQPDLLIMSVCGWPVACPLSNIWTNWHSHQRIPVLRSVLFPTTVIPTWRSCILVKGTDGLKWRWGRFSPRTSVSPANLHSICFFTIIFTIIRGWHNMPGVASQTKIIKNGDRCERNVKQFSVLKCYVLEEFRWGIICHEKRDCDWVKCIFHVNVVTSLTAFVK